MFDRLHRVDRRWLLVPSSGGKARHRVIIEVDGRVLHSFETPLSTAGKVEWWAPVDLGAYVGRSIALAADTEAFFREVRWSEAVRRVGGSDGQCRADQRSEGNYTGRGRRAF